MGNRISLLKQEPTTRSWNLFLWTLVFLGSWFLLLGSFSAQGAEKIVSLNACTDELLLQFAEPEKIAGVTRFRHSPLSSKVLNDHPEIQRLSGDVEAIHKLQPSQVIAGPFSNLMLLEQLRKSNIKVLILNDPRNWEELLVSVKLIEERTGVSEKAAAFRRKIFNLHVEGAHSKWVGKKALFWSAGGNVPGKGTFEDVILSTLGIENAAHFEGYAFLSLEQMIQLAPDLLWVTQDPKQRNSWSHDTVFHPVLRKALPQLEWVVMPEEAISCASGYTVDMLENILNGEKK